MNLNGTVNTLISTLRFNGKELNAVEFGTMAKVFGDAFATKVGSVKKDGARGKPATIWQLSENSPVLVTEAVNADETTDDVGGQSNDDAPQE